MPQMVSRPFIGRHNGLWAARRQGPSRPLPAPIRPRGALKPRGPAGLTAGLSFSLHPHRWAPAGASRQPGHRHADHPGRPPRRVPPGRRRPRGAGRAAHVHHPQRRRRLRHRPLPRQPATTAAAPPPTPIARRTSSRRPRAIARSTATTSPAPSRPAPPAAARAAAATTSSPSSARSKARLPYIPAKAATRRPPTALTSVMAGLVPAIHVLLAACPCKACDARHKAGHDGVSCVRPPWPARSLP